MVTALTRRRKIRLLQFLIVVAAVLLLEWLVRAGLIGEITLAAPTEMVTELVSLLLSGKIFNDIYQTAISTFAAFLLASAIGIPTGWVLWNWNTFQRVLDPYLIAFYSLPIFALYPMLIAIFGLNKIPIILVAFLMSIVAIIINTANGFGQIRDVYHDVGRSLQLSRYETFVHIQFPASVPYIFTGLKLGFIYALIGVIASEFILASSGLGYQVAYDYNNFATSEMYAEMLLVIIIAVAMNQILVRIEENLHQRSTTQ
jgi:NitT/TauT family transport system permease protein